MSMFCVLPPCTGNLAGSIGAEVRIVLDLDGVAGLGMWFDGLRLGLVGWTGVDDSNSHYQHGNAESDFHD
ncbi:hypothetical protein BC937DRAFT_92653 [Endogone sp. FLAS-F59071]|nr:hypothetical protein BC937DRAFT_92653 [Endogone sp. FLAS-F59071]|eukprot:RUS21452.1 hypothetical protein BC937DRAFT_92653 [Endogone sp. FLAS-F59071]